MEKLDFLSPLSPANTAWLPCSPMRKKLEAFSLEDSVETSSQGVTSTMRMGIKRVSDKREKRE